MSSKRYHHGDLPAALVEAAEAGLLGLIEAFENQETPYLAVPDPGLAPAFDDYAHLARIKVDEDRLPALAQPVKRAYLRR